MYFEGMEAGMVIPIGTHPPVGADDITAFARQWDPQSFHLDAEAATESIFGGLVASGWHTACIGMRLLATSAVLGHSQGSPGLANLRFLRPVRPGDTISGTFVVMRAEPSASRPHLGKVASRLELRNQHDEVVLTWESTVFVLRRP